MLKALFAKILIGCFVITLLGSRLSVSYQDVTRSMIQIVNMADSGDGDLSDDSLTDIGGSDTVVTLPVHHSIRVTVVSTKFVPHYQGLASQSVLSSIERPPRL